MRLRGEIVDLGGRNRLQEAGERGHVGQIGVVKLQALRDAEPAEAMTATPRWDDRRIMP